jgi:ketosteroid isomerase-like protein
MKKLWVTLIAGVILIPLGMWWSSPENVIMRKTKRLMEVLSLSEGSVGPLRQAKVFSMNGMLAPDVELVIPEIEDANGTFDKEELESAFTWICKNAKESQFDVIAFRDVVLNGDTATVSCIVKGYLDLGYVRPADGTYDVTIVWKKGGDGWRYNEVVWEKP